jgi:energy-coupling factor transport system permease protein
MRSPLAYRPRSRPLQLADPGAAVAYLGAFALAAFLFADPLLLCAIMLAACLAGYLAGVGGAVRFGLRMGLLLVVLMVVVNGLVNARGSTVVMRLGEWPLFGRVDVTLESLAAGAVIGLRGLAVMVVASVYSAAVDPDRVLRALRPWLRRSALTAGLASRLLPVMLDDAGRLSEAAKLRGPGAAPVGRGPMARRLLAGSLDRAVDVAATLELRGYSLPAPRSSGRLRLSSRSPVESRGRRSRFNRRFILAAAFVGLGSLALRFSGVGGFDPYPTVDYTVGWANGVAALALIAAGAVPVYRAPATDGRRR